MEKEISIGINSFPELIERNYYYVDKTAFIKELIKQNAKAILITRPRRFGKSLTMSMLEDFFDIGRDSKAHFENLAISKDAAFCDEWMNKWPVISISLKSVEGRNFQIAYGRMKTVVSSVCKKYMFLMDSGKANPADKELFRDLLFQKANVENLSDCLLILSRMMSDHYGKPAIILIDEYDVPLAKAHDKGYYEDMLDIIRALLGSALKENPYLEFAVITGCLKISKESIFTGINNLATNTITSDRFDEGFGFTEQEVLKLLSDAGYADHADEVRAWYDGYRFGNVDVYCPWDVLNHVSALLANPKVKPKPYWRNTSGNDVIYRLFENKAIDANEKFETLLSGGCIRETITEELTYGTLEASEESLWSLLFMTGYLTQAKSSEDEREADDDTIALRIPNEEVKRIFRDSVVKWFQKSVLEVDRSGIFKAFWEGNGKSAEKEISDLLFMTISYHDYNETFYHAFVAGLFAGEYKVSSNKEQGDGRPDVVVRDLRNRKVLVLEMKHARDGETLEHAVKAAVNQIRERRYDEPFLQQGYYAVLCYGIAFKGKSCMIERANAE